MLLPDPTSFFSFSFRFVCLQSKRQIFEYRTSSPPFPLHSSWPCNFAIKKKKRKQLPIERKRGEQKALTKRLIWMLHPFCFSSLLHLTFFPLFLFNCSFFGGVELFVCYLKSETVFCLPLEFRRPTLLFRFSSLLHHSSSVFSLSSCSCCWRWETFFFWLSSWLIKSASYFSLFLVWIFLGGYFCLDIRPLSFLRCFCCCSGGGELMACDALLMPPALRVDSRAGCVSRGNSDGRPFFFLFGHSRLERVDWWSRWRTTRPVEGLKGRESGRETPRYISRYFFLQQRKRERDASWRKEGGRHQQRDSATIEMDASGAKDVFFLFCLVGWFERKCGRRGGSLMTIYADGAGVHVSLLFFSSWVWLCG